MATSTTRLRQVRLDRGLSIRTVALATGVPKSTLHRIESGARVIKREHARALYKYYDYEVDMSDIYDPAFDAQVAGAK